MAQALVPLKDLVQAKTRLAGLLRPSERRALAQAMAEDVLTVLANHPDIQGITLISDDPGAGLLAQKYRAHCWPEQTLGGGGLNALIQSASARLLAEDAGTLVVLHADLPLLTQQDISEALRRQCALGGLLIGCDHQGTGTNLLAFDAANTPVHFRFGANSCAAHANDARSAGIPVEILQRSGIGVDVDEARDLKYIMAGLQQYSERYTAKLLLESDLGSRLGIALATVLDEVEPVETTIGAAAATDGNRGKLN